MGMRLYLCMFFAVVACGPSGRPCMDGEHACAGNELQTCTNGEFADSQACAMACDTLLGCVTCVPGTGTCTGDVSHACRADGSGFDDIYCDPVQGEMCGTSGVCVGACSPAALGQTYLGCDYWPTVTGNPVAAIYDFAIVVSNTTNTDATVTIDGGALATAATFNAPAGTSVVHNLPWVDALKICGMNASSFDCTSGPHEGDALAVKGSYHLRSTQPVT